MRCQFDIGFMMAFDETGLQEHYKWVPTEHATALGIDIGHQGLHLTVAIDDTTLWQGPVQDLADQSITTEIHDSDSNQIRQMTLAFSGWQDHHMPLIAPDISNRAAVRLRSLVIEEIDVTSVFDRDNDTGGLIFSGNQTNNWKFHTPIYSWLLEQARDLKLAVIY